MELGKIYNENCLETLARMPDEFVDCVVTSPPYYGLRSYSAPDSIWGGDKDCSHEFGLAQPRAINLQAGNPEYQRKWRESATDSEASKGAFCECAAWKGQLGLEPTFQLYLDHLIQIFAEVKRVLKPTGTVWVNLGDSYTGSGKGGHSAEKRSENWAPIYPKIAPVQRNAAVTKFAGEKRTPDGLRSKSLMNIPARFAIRMTDELQFIERNEIIWHKPACMPSSAKDRFTVDFEKIFFFTKSEKYYFEQQFDSLSSKHSFRYAKEYSTAVSNGNGQPNNVNHKGIHSRPGGDRRNARTVWSVNYEPSSENHFASYPTKLIVTPIKAGCPENGIVYDPFAGTGTTLEVAHKLGRKWIGSEISTEYCEIANKRLAPYLAQTGLF